MSLNDTSSLPVLIKAQGKNYRQFAFIFVVLALRMASEPTANLSYLLLIVYALVGRVQVIHAFAMLWIFSMLSGGIAPPATAASIGRYAVIAAGAISVLFRSGGSEGPSGTSHLTLATALLGVLLVMHSLLFSPIVDVSILKAISWAITTTTLFAAWEALNDKEKELVASQIFGMLVVTMLLSLPLLALPLGYLTNGTGFQGILNHPQGFGSTIALLGAWAGGRMFGGPRPSRRLLLLVGVCFLLVVLSESRTGALGMVGGLGLAVLLTPLLAWRPVRAVLPGLMSRRLRVASSAIVLGMVLGASMLIDRFDDFISKGSRAEVTGLANAYEISRGLLIDTMLENIALQPFFGIGFGIASSHNEMDVERDPILGLPTSASIEKGVLPVAVLEEIGILGTAAVLAWLWLLLRQASRSGVTALALVITTLILNFGESTFFSPGGLGLLPMILITLAGSARSLRSQV
jgi:hypothetical protein